MTGAGRTRGVVFGSVVAMACAAAAPPGMPALPMGAGPPRVALADVVEPRFRDAVLAVVRKPTISTRATADDLICPPALYDWLLAHPDRVALAWRRLKVPCVEIADAGNGTFTWADGDGSELVWQAVGRFPDGLVWYATGKVKPSPVTPTVPIKAVVVMSHPNRPTADGKAAITPSVQVFLQTDSRAATLVLRLIGPTAPKLAQEGAEQLLMFFGGVAQAATARPEKAEELLAPARK